MALSRLQARRLVELNGEITQEAADRVITRILQLEADDKTSDIVLCLDSRGGEVKAGLAVYEAMQFTCCDVVTLCTGSAASMAMLLLAAGAQGKRMALHNARIMLHQPWDTAAGERVDRKKQLEHMICLKALLNDILRKHAKGCPAGFPGDVERNLFLTPAEAQTLGIIDRIVYFSYNISPGINLKSFVL